MRSAVILGVSSLAMFASNAQAQDASVEPDDSSSTIVVTAQFRESDLQETPLAITALNAEMLEARGIDSVEQVAQSAPSVTLSPTAASYGKGTAAYIRGIGQFDFSPALDPGVGIYIDDVYFATVFGSAFDLVDVDRVEVSRGPQGTLSGKNSIGGTVRVYSAAPDGSGGGSVTAGYGSNNRIDVRASADFEVAEDVVFARISGVARQGGGYVDRLDYGCLNPTSGIPAQAAARSDCRLGTTGGDDLVAGRLYLRAVPSDQLEISLIADVTEDNSEPSAATLIIARPATYFGTAFDLRPFIPADRFVTYAPYSSVVNAATGQTLSVPPTSQSDNWGVSGTIDYELGENFSIKSITAYRAIDGQFALDDETPIDALMYLQRLHSTQFTQELRLNGRVGDIANFTFGAFYFDNEIHNEGRVFTINTFDVNLDDRVKSKSNAVFAHLELRPMDALTLTGGLRYTEDEKTFTFGRTEAQGAPYGAFGLFGVNAGINGVTNTFSDNRIDWRVAANYEITPDIMLYGQVSTGYKGGGINPRPFNAQQVLPFDPETVTTYEAGLKTFLLDRTLRLNFAAFSSSYNDIQFTFTVCPPALGFPCNLVANAADATIQGLEVEADWQPVDGFQFDGSLSYLDFKYRNITAGLAVGGSPPYTPEWKISAGMQYEIPVGEASITPRVDFIYQSSVFFDAVNLPEAFEPGYGLFNGRVTWRSADEDWQVALAVTNIFETEYYVNRMVGFTSSFGGTYGIPGRPREWNVSVTRRF
jgi:iron complex outermembrane receptor protein